MAETADIGAYTWLIKKSPRGRLRIVNGNLEGDVAPGGFYVQYRGTKFMIMRSRSPEICLTVIGGASKPAAKRVMPAPRGRLTPGNSPVM